MQLVEDDLLPGPAPPADVVPVVGRRIDDLARAVDALRLTARSRVGKGLAVDEIAVACARSGSGDCQRKPAAGLARPSALRPGPASSRNGHRVGARRPQPEARATRDRLGAERELIMTTHRLSPGLRAATEAHRSYPVARPVDEQRERMAFQPIDLARRVELASVRARSAPRCRRAAPKTSALRAPESESRDRRDRR